MVTLLTDFGLSDPYVGVMKGVLLREAGDLGALVDLTHDVPAQDVRTASFFLARSWSWFPPGTVHVAVVDPGVGSERGILLALVGGHAFLAPDNGLLAPLLEDASDARILRADVAGQGLDRGSRTFHGRDRFAPLGGRLARGDDPFAMGSGTDRWERLALSGARRGPAGSVEGEVLLVDRFGNLVTSVPSSLLGGAPAGRWRVRLAGREVRLVGTYAEAEVGELVALVDSYDLVELAVRDGNAAHEIAAGVGAPVELLPEGAA